MTMTSYVYPETAWTKKVDIVASWYDDTYEWAVPEGYEVHWVEYTGRDEYCKRHEEFATLYCEPMVAVEVPREDDCVELCGDCCCPVPAGDHYCEECRPLEVM